MSSWCPEWPRIAKRPVAVGLLIVVSGVASAAEWRNQPGFTAKLEFTDNLRLASNEQLEVVSQITSFSTRMSALQPRQAFHIVPTLRHAERSNGDLFDSDEYGLDASWERSGLTWSVAADAGYAVDSTLTTEFETTGLVDAQKDREQQRAGANMTWYLSETTQMFVGGAWQDNKYEDAEQTGLVDFSYGVVSAGFSRALGSTQSVGVTVTADRFRTAGGDRKSTSQSVLATWSATPDPLWRLEAQGGVRRTEGERTLFFFGIPIAELDETDYGETGRVTITRQGLRDRTNFLASRELRPGGGGTVFQQDEIELRHLRELTQRLSVSASVSYLRNEELGNGGGFSQRDLTTFEVGGGWKLTEDLRLRAGYAFRSRDSERAGRAEENRVTLSFEYQFPRWSLSR